MKTYQQWDERLGKRESLKVGNHTYVQRRGEDIAIKLHDTDILTFKANGDIVYNTAGWKTVTTKARLNEYGPVRINQENRIWFVNDKVYADGMTVKGDRTITGCGENPKTEKKLQRKIAEYCRLFAGEFLAGKVEKPGMGDCFYCQMREVKTGNPLGEVINDKDHLLSHIAEGYFVPSLLYRAVEKANGTLSMIAKARIGEIWNSAEVQHEGFDDIVKDQITKTLAKYIRHELAMV